MERGHAVLVHRVHVAAFFGECDFEQLGLPLVLAHGLDEQRVNGRRLLLDIGRIAPVWGVDGLALRVVRVDLGEAGIDCSDHRDELPAQTITGDSTASRRSCVAGHKREAMRGTSFDGG